MNKKEDTILKKEPLFCPNCGSQRIKDAKFCVQCGNKLIIKPEEKIPIQPEMKKLTEEKLIKTEKESAEERIAIEKILSIADMFIERELFRNAKIILNDIIAKTEIYDILVQAQEKLDLCNEIIGKKPPVKKDIIIQTAPKEEKIIIGEVRDAKVLARIAKAEKKGKLLRYFYIDERYSIEDLKKKFKIPSKDIKRILQNEGVKIDK